MKTKIIKVIIIICGIVIGIFATMFLSNAVVDRKEQKSYIERAISAIESIAKEEKKQTSLMEKR